LTARRAPGILPAMTDERLGGAALIAGAVGMMITMLLHPTGHALLSAGEGFAPMAALAAGVHALGIASMPVLLLGALVLTRRLAAPGRLAVVALVVYGFAMVAGMAAAAVSGFVGPGLAREVLAAEGAQMEVWQAVASYNWRVNQAFTQVLTVGSSLALFLWSIAIVRRRDLPRGFAVYGLVAAPLTVLLLLVGHLRLDVHGFGLVVLAQAVWLIGTGVLLWRACST
jgi:hypothetical protein